MTDSSKTPDRVVVFVDEANVYNDARRCFAPVAASSSWGRVDPMAYAQRIIEKGSRGKAPDRALREVRVYTGMPGADRDPASYAAHRRQSAAWRAAGATVIARPLRYPGKNKPPVQKGVDVHIAVDMVAMAIRGEYDVGILASTDTDLRPPLEAIFDLQADGCPCVEVAAWKAGGFAHRLTVAGRHLWCHYLDEDDYRAVCDRTSYATAQT